MSQELRSFKFEMSLLSTDELHNTLNEHRVVCFDFILFVRRHCYHLITFANIHMGSDSCDDERLQTT